MGCETSREQSHTTSYSRIPDEASEFMTMGNPPSASFIPQHERLVLELLPLKNPPAFREWINGPLVQGSWHEFLRDFLSRNPTAPEAEKDRVAEQAKEAISSKLVKYLAYHPVKTDWTAEDHHTRFIVTVVGDNLLKGGIWAGMDWNSAGGAKRLLTTKAAYEVLSYLRTMAAVSQEGNPPSYNA